MAMTPPTMSCQPCSINIEKRPLVVRLSGAYLIPLYPPPSFLEFDVAADGGAQSVRAEPAPLAKSRISKRSRRYNPLIVAHAAKLYNAIGSPRSALSNRSATVPPTRVPPEEAATPAINRAMMTVSCEFSSESEAC